MNILMNNTLADFAGRLLQYNQETNSEAFNINLVTSLDTGHGRLAILDMRDNSALSIGYSGDFLTIARAVNAEIDDPSQSITGRWFDMNVLTAMGYGIEISAGDHHHRPMTHALKLDMKSLMLTTYGIYSDNIPWLIDIHYNSGTDSYIDFIEDHPLGSVYVDDEERWAHLNTII